MNIRILHKAGIAILSTILLTAGGPAFSENSNMSGQTRAPGSAPPMQQGMPPNNYQPPYPPWYPREYPYYQPPAWDARSAFDDPWFRRHGYGDWDPYAEIQRMQWEMERFIENTFRRFDLDRSWHRMNGVITPGLDLRDEGDHYIAIVDIPGADKDAINIELKDRMLSISAQQHQENKRTDSQGNIIFQERRSGVFRRMVTLPEPVSASDMKSEYKDGVLTITIPKKQG